jgi:glycosyltransferase involved in cell wall biosynthesis
MESVMSVEKVELSVIIPCYNNPDDVNRLVTRLVTLATNADLNLEIIIVDDGSKVPIELADIDEFSIPVNLCCKENGGVSVARNYGLARASGNYSVFIDSDDDVEDDFIGLISSQIREASSDILYFPYKVVCDGKETQRGSRLRGEVGNIVLLKSLFLKETFFHICSFIFKTEFLISNELEFNAGIRLSEDVLFIVEATKLANKVFASDKGYFRYIANSTSVINTDQGMKELNHLEAFTKIRDEKYPESELEKNYFLFTCILNMYVRILNRSSSDNYVRKQVLEKVIDFSHSIGPAKNKINDIRSLVVFMFKCSIKLKMGKLLTYLGTVK